MYSFSVYKKIFSLYNKIFLYTKPYMTLVFETEN